jgi:hypothetical protein
MFFVNSTQTLQLPVVTPEQGDVSVARNEMGVLRMRSTMMTLAAALLIAPAAMAQTQPQPGTQSPGQGSTMPGATAPGAMTNPPGATTPGGTAPGATMPGTRAPGATTAAPGAGMPSDGAARRDATPPTTATPAAGANSFTEGQARGRIEAAGYTNVREMRKDDQGVWRARAMRNGSEADVGLDFQGNVVTGNAPAR